MADKTQTQDLTLKEIESLKGQECFLLRLTKPLRHDMRKKGVMQQ